MATGQTRREGTGGGQVTPLPLRSLAPVWILLSAFGVLVLAFATRSVWLGGAAQSKVSAAPAAQGPTKRQVRERQEHIALTERALELARKERKAAAAAAAPAPAASTPSAAAPGATLAPRADASPRVAATSAPASAGEGSPAPAEKAAPKAAASGLDAMRADIAAALE